MVDFVVLGSLTIFFLDPQRMMHPFAGKDSVKTQQQAAAPSASPAPAAPSQAASAPQTPAVRPEAAAPPSKSASAPSAPAKPTESQAPASATDGSKSVANLKKLPPWAAVAVTPVTTPGLHGIPIPFSNFVTGAWHPASRYITIDERSFANLPYQLRETIKTALVARSNQDAERMRTVLKDVESPEGTPDLLMALSYLINQTPESVGLAEKSYRVALQKGQPQAPVLLGLLLTSNAKGFTGTSAEGKSLVESVLSNDRVAWFAAGNSYLSGENGTLDPIKAVPWIIKAAEAGEPAALLQYARLAESGIGMEKNTPLAEGALRRAADLGLTEAEDILGRWILQAYENKAIEDPTEGVKIQDRVIAKNSMSSLGVLSRFYVFYARDQWKNQQLGVQMMQQCAEYRMGACQNNLGIILQSGRRGLDRDIVAAWARYDVARQINRDSVMKGLSELDKIMTPTEKDEARQQSKDILAKLKNLPVAIALRRDP